VTWNLPDAEAGGHRGRGASASAVVVCTGSEA